MGSFNTDPMIELFIVETTQMLDKLEQLVLEAEGKGLDSSINEIFRLMHSIKGAASMMLYNGIAHLSHTVEDLFAYLRNGNAKQIDCKKVTNFVLCSIDFIKEELIKIQNRVESNGDPSGIIDQINVYLNEIKNSGEIKQAEESVQTKEEQKYYISSTKANTDEAAKRYSVVMFFEEGAGMENVRAFTVIQRLKEIATSVDHYPKEITEDDKTADIIVNEGFKIDFNCEYDVEKINHVFIETPLIKNVEIKEIFEDNTETKNRNKQIILDETEREPEKNNEKGSLEKSLSLGTQSVINVNISKLDTLMDLVGELVISEAMVTQNPELRGLNLNNFYKASRQLKKITNEIQDNVMSIRMVPLAMTFQKMNRIVRDMTQKLDKEVQLEIIGEGTEVDKSIIENVSDPIMHIIRNAIDHGIETKGERLQKGKSEKGKIVLEAKNSGGEVWIIVKDDGKGLNKEKILKTAKEKGLVNKPGNELSDKEIFSFIFAPGFSTKEAVTEYSGRGVGMDVVIKNIEKIKGSVQVDSIAGEGTTITIKIPLSLAIINGMNVRVGKSRYTIPITCIKESFKLKEDEILKNTDGTEMILLRGDCYPVIRLYKFFGVETNIKNADDGIIIMIEEGEKAISIFADELIGEQQVVVKSLPKYINSVKGVSGCTLLGDGNISLIVDVPVLTNY